MVAALPSPAQPHPPRHAQPPQAVRRRRPGRLRRIAQHRRQGFPTRRHQPRTRRPRRRPARRRDGSRHPRRLVHGNRRHAGSPTSTCPPPPATRAARSSPAAPPIRSKASNPSSSGRSTPPRAGSCSSPRTSSPMTASSALSAPPSPAASASTSWSPPSSTSASSSLAQCSYYEELLSCGVRIHAYRDYLLHAKNVSIDERLAILGSSNVDLRSFELNEEVSLLLYAGDSVRALGRRPECLHRPQQPHRPRRLAPPLRRPQIRREPRSA